MFEPCCYVIKWFGSPASLFSQVRQFLFCLLVLQEKHCLLLSLLIHSHATNTFGLMKVNTMKTITQNEPRTLVEAIRFFSNPDICLQFLIPVIWPNGVT